MTKNLNIGSWRDLSRFGIEMLTGEACNLSLRLLCDVNEEGRELLCEYLGIHPEGFAKPMNSQVDGKPSVGSIMLHRDSLAQLAEFTLFRAGVLAVAHAGYAWVGVTEAADIPRWEEYVALEPGRQLRRNPAMAVPHVGTRNVHAFTGRHI